MQNPHWQPCRPHRRRWHHRRTAAHAKAAGLTYATTFNLGEGLDDFRVPDGGYFREIADAAFIPHAEVVVEILSPDDETYDKFDFYAAHGVQEVLVAHPRERWVRCYDVQHGHVEVSSSRCLGVAMADVTAEIAWPG